MAQTLAVSENAGYYPVVFNSDEHETPLHEALERLEEVNELRPPSVQMAEWVGLQMKTVADVLVQMQEQTADTNRTVNGALCSLCCTRFAVRGKQCDDCHKTMKKMHGWE